MTQKNKINTRKAILLRAYVVFALVSGFSVFIVYSMFKLQNGFDKEFSVEQQKKNTRVIKVEGIRGNIYAEDGSHISFTAQRGRIPQWCISR